MTVIVRRQAKAGLEAKFETAMQEFIAFTLPFPGNQGIHVLRPSAGGSRESTVINRFADSEARDAFRSSVEYKDWMERLRSLTEEDPNIEEMHGLSGWFTLPGQAKAPTRIKMAVVTYLGVYPLTSVIPSATSQLLPSWHPLAVNLVVSAIVVAALAWIVMPLLTRLFATWLFDK